MIFYSVKYWYNFLSLFILNIITDSLADGVNIIIKIRVNNIIYNISIYNVVDVVMGIIRKVVNIIINIIGYVVRGITNINIII